MELNTQIWGDNTEWQIDETINYYDVSIKAYNGKYKSLSEYVTNNIFELNTAIDNTILYCGQAAGVTPWGDRAIYSGFDSLEGTTPVPTLEINRQADIALFTVQNNTSHYCGIDGIRAIMDESTNPDSLTNTGYTRWSPYARNFPDTEYPNTNLPNTNYMLCPVVDFDLRCMIGIIYVDVCSTIDGTRSTMTLYDFEHGNYSDYVILQAFMKLALLSGTDTYSIVQISTPSRAIGFVDMRPIETATGDYINYMESVRNTPSIPLFGFDEDRYSWNSTYRCFNTYWGYNNSNTEYTNSMSHAGVLYSASRATFIHYNIQKDYQTYSGLYNLWYYMENSADNLEYLRKAAAAYGIWFTDNPTNDILLSPTRWTDNNMMLGLLRDGVGYGDYTRGTGNVDNPAYNWTSSHQSGYDPSAGHDPNTYTDTTDFPEQFFDYPTFVTYYDRSLEACKYVPKQITTMQGDYEDNLQALLYQEPVDLIVDMHRVYLNPDKLGLIAEAATTFVTLGGLTTDVELPPMSIQHKRIEFEPKKIWRHFNNFLDFEPYSSASLYIPYCGTCELPLRMFMGHNLNIKINVNARTGDLQALILADNLLWITMEGNAAENLITSGNRMNNYLNTIETARNQKELALQNNLQSIAGNAAGASISLAMNNPLGFIAQEGMMINQILNRENISEQYDYIIKSARPTTVQIGAASKAVACYNSLTPMILLTRPVIIPENSLETYGKTIGHSCVINTQIKNLKGFTICNNANLDGISCTLTEKEMILQALREGIILDEEGQ